MESVGCHFERKKTLPEYIAQKISMLEDELYLRLDYAEIAHMRNLNTVADVARFAHHILVIDCKKENYT